jgi:hypothetical protein
MKGTEGRARGLFERSVEHLDDAAIRRLRLARRSTLASEVATHRGWRAWPAGLAAAGVLALGLAWWWPHDAARPQAPVASTHASADAEEPVLAEADDDADLYVFLADAPVAADSQEHRL